MEHFHSDWTFKPITMLHVNAPTYTILDPRQALIGALSVTDSL